MWKATGMTGIVAKVWHKPAERELTAKLNAMLKINPRITVDGEIAAAWPTEGIYDGRGSLRGFLMPEAQNTTAIENLYTRRRRDEKNITVRRHEAARLAMRIAATMEILHRNNCYIGDVNPKNILVRRDNLFPFIIDCDSFQIPNPQDPGRPFLSTVMWAEYQPPERIESGTVPIDDYNDTFCLAVLTYMLLFNGVHPFQGKDNSGIKPVETREERIAAHRFTHAFPRDWEIRPDQQDEWSRLPRELQQKFNRAMDYKRYGRNRPKAQELKEALRLIANDPQKGWLPSAAPTQKPNKTAGRTTSARNQLQSQAPAQQPSRTPKPSTNGRGQQPNPVKSGQTTPTASQPVGKYKTCRNCGKRFTPNAPHHRECPPCHRARTKQNAPFDSKAKNTKEGLTGDFLQDVWKGEWWSELFWGKRQ